VSGLDLSPIAAMKTAQAMQARATAKMYIDTMKEHSLASLLVHQQTGATDAGGFFMGYLDQALDEAGFTIAHMACFPSGQAPNGTMVLMYTLLIRSKTGAPQRVMLA
jgi:hypothetical protein